MEGTYVAPSWYRANRRNARESWWTHSPPSPTWYSYISDGLRGSRVPTWVTASNRVRESATVPRLLTSRFDNEPRIWAEPKPSRWWSTENRPTQRSRTTHRARSNGSCSNSLSRLAWLHRRWEWSPIADWLHPRQSLTRNRKWAAVLDTRTSERPTWGTCGSRRRVAQPKHRCLHCLREQCCLYLPLPTRNQSPLATAGSPQTTPHLHESWHELTLELPVALVSRWIK